MLVDLPSRSGLGIRGDLDSASGFTGWGWRAESSQLSEADKRGNLQWNFVQ
jgi:hypothetical protein